MNLFFHSFLLARSNSLLQEKRAQVTILFKIQKIASNFTLLSVLNPHLINARLMLQNEKENSVDYAMNRR